MGNTTIKVMLNMMLLAALMVISDHAKTQSMREDGARAYESYWNHFDIYEKALLKKDKKHYLKALDQLRQTFSKSNRHLLIKRVEILKRAQQAYTDQLQEHPHSSTRAHVLLNLAHVYLELFASQQDQGIDDSGYIEQALALLLEIQKNFPNFRLKDQAAYLLAITYHQAEDQHAALATWQMLAKRPAASVFKVHALTALGDSSFKSDHPVEAGEFFEQAYRLLKTLQMKDQEVQLIKLEYRNLWASFRSGHSDDVLKYGRKILRPNRFVLNVQEFAKLQLDAIELIGDTLYDHSDINRVVQFLKDSSIRDAISPIILQVIKRYYAGKHYRKIIKIGQAVISQIPLSLELPGILQRVGDAYGHEKRIDAQMKTYEELAYLLPKNSLWRQRFGANVRAVESMETIAFDSTKKLAIWSYKKAFRAHQGTLYIKAASFFRILIDFSPQVEESLAWALYQANCYYYASQFDEAIILYNQLKDHSDLSDDLFQKVLYQIVLTNEHKWKAIARTSLHSVDKDRYETQSLAALMDLQKSVELYIAKFPSTERSIDLLLVGASAYRDHGSYDRAIVMWEKVLLSKALARQRKLAIRGILFAKTVAGTPGIVVIAARRYLRLENWKNFDKDLRSEILSILIKAARDETKRLKNSGHIVEAGQLLIQLAREFEDLPGRATFLRDAAYTLALGGSWNQTLEAIEVFENSGLLQHGGDMLYLKGKTLEYLFKFAQAAESYIELSSRFPKHKKRLVALSRGKVLAEGEDMYGMAGEAAIVESRLRKRRSARISISQEAMLYYTKANDRDGLNKAARIHRKLVKGVKAKLKSDLLLARMHQKIGETKSAITILQQISQKLNRFRSSLSPDDRQQISGETSLLIGQFMALKINSVDTVLNLDQKREIFKKVRYSLEKAIGSRREGIVAHARWLLGVTAESLGIHILESTNDKSNGTRIIGQNLIDLSKKLHGANLITLAHSSSSHGGRKFLLKSQMRLANSLSDFRRASYFRYQKPFAYHFELPHQWSKR